MLNYQQHFHGLVVQLEVQGWTVYTTESEFNTLKTAIEAGNDDPRFPKYSLRKVNGCICETYIIK
jgi:AMMECR1 domain-containing protein